MFRRTFAHRMIAVLAVAFLMVAGLVVATQWYTGAEARSSAQVAGTSNWEYKVVEIPLAKLTAGSIIDAADLQKTLDPLGAQGWDLAQIVPNGLSGNVAVFKRPLK